MKVYAQLLLTFLSIPVAFYAQESRSVFDLLSANELVEIELTTDLQLLRDQKNTNEYQPATLSYAVGKKQTESWEIKIRSRGKYRRRVCVFPPLKLNFPKGQLKEKGLSGEDELKLITHCVEGEPGKDYLMREYLVYKLFEKLSPIYIRVHPAKVKYIDPATGEKINAWGILVDDEKALERRYQADLCEDCFSFPKEGFQKEQLSLVFLFEYLISNTDWSAAMVRNLYMLRPKDGSGAMLIPYDFDFSGFVNASYARPNTDFKQTHVRERLFLGPDLSDEEIKPAIELFRSKRKELETVIREFRYLSGESKIDLLNFLDGFYLSLGQGIKRPAQTE
ncbi:MAG: hypothetical protein KIPDCIKN_01289 [Haliscomenobacter sp.]|jgi:hypothetical protein|nr:hypothetical protein [Haliscomenobacter sp.]